MKLSFYNKIHIRTIAQSISIGSQYSVNTFCLFDLILTTQSTLFQLCQEGLTCVEPVLSKDKCVLLKDTTQ